MRNLIVSHKVDQLCLRYYVGVLFRWFIHAYRQRFLRSAIFFIYYRNYTRRIDFCCALFYPGAHYTCPRVLLQKKEKRKTNSGNHTQTSHEQSHPDATACSCILNRQLLLSRATDDPFNLKEWKVSRQQVKGESSRRIEETGKRNDQKEDPKEPYGVQKGRLSKLFLSNWSCAFHVFSIFFFSTRIIKSLEESRRNAKVYRSYPENWRFGWRRRDS